MSCGNLCPCQFTWDAQGYKREPVSSKKAWLDFAVRSLSREAVGKGKGQEAVWNAACKPAWWGAEVGLSWKNPTAVPKDTKETLLQKYEALESHLRLEGRFPKELEEEARLWAAGKYKELFLFVSLNNLLGKVSGVHSAVLDSMAKADKIKAEINEKILYDIETCLSSALCALKTKKAPSQKTLTKRAVDNFDERNSDHMEFKRPRQEIPTKTSKKSLTSNDYLKTNNELRKSKSSKLEKESLNRISAKQLSTIKKGKKNKCSSTKNLLSSLQATEDRANYAVGNESQVTSVHVQPPHCMTDQEPDIAIQISEENVDPSNQILMHDLFLSPSPKLNKSFSFLELLDQHETTEESSPSSSKSQAALEFDSSSLEKSLDVGNFADFLEHSGCNEIENILNSFSSGFQNNLLVCNADSSLVPDIVFSVTKNLHQSIPISENPDHFIPVSISDSIFNLTNQIPSSSEVPAHIAETIDFSKCDNTPSNSNSKDFENNLLPRPNFEQVASSTRLSSGRVDSSHSTQSSTVTDSGYVSNEEPPALNLGEDGQTLDFVDALFSVQEQNQFGEEDGSFVKEKFFDGLC